jgi:hypothetical protein
MLVPVSVGELIDKLSILQVKKNKVKNESKLEYINKEYELLYNLSVSFLSRKEINEKFNELIEINTKLWDIEDRLRVMESEKRFEGEFIDFARKVYITNDMRFELKNTINTLTASSIREVKEYVNYK